MPQPSHSTGVPWVDALDKNFVWTEDMSPAESATMLRYGPATLAAARGAAQVGGGPGPLLMTQRPAAGNVGGLIDRLAALSATLGTPLARAGAVMPAAKAVTHAETPLSFLSPGARRGLRFVAEQAAERIPGPSRAKLAELLGRSGNIRPLANPAEQLSSPIARAQGVAGDINMPQLVAETMETSGGPKHYMRLLNQLLKQRNPVAQNPDQAGAYELLLLELLSGRLP